jgi:hypothetical protein
VGVVLDFKVVWKKVAITFLEFILSQYLANYRDTNVA